MTNNYEFGEYIIEISPKRIVKDSIGDDIFGSPEINLDYLSKRVIFPRMRTL